MQADVRRPGLHFCFIGMETFFLQQQFLKIVFTFDGFSVFWGKLLYPSFFCFSQIKSATFSVFSCKIFKKTLDTPVFAR